MKPLVTSLRLPIFGMCICVLICGLVGYGWAQAPDTEAVKAVIDQSIKASNDHNLDLLLTLYSDDAMIDSKAAGAKISKSAFKETLSKFWQQDSKTWVEYSGLQISLGDATHAVATGKYYIHLQNGQNIIQPNEWKLEKRDGRWLIVETTYK